MNSKLKIGLVQYAPVWEDKSANVKKIKNLLSDKIVYDLLIFPEMTLTGFTMKSEEFAEDLEDDTKLFFAYIAKEKKCAVMYGTIEKGKKKNFNTLVHLNNQGKIVNTYRKIHPFSYSKENIFYGKGKNTITTKIKGY